VDTPHLHIRAIGIRHFRPVYSPGKRTLTNVSGRPCG
jgi:hypothetical protein